MYCAPTPFIDTNKNLTSDHCEYIEKYTWDFPNDFDPSDIPNYKTAYVACIRYLISVSSVRTTLNTASSEIEKLLQFAYRIRSKHLFSMNDSDLVEYMNFIKSPPINWVSNGPQKRFIEDGGNRIPNKNWRPFCANKGGNISQSSMNKSFSFMKSFYMYLYDLGLIKSDPAALLKKKQFVQKIDAGRSISKKILTVEDRELIEGTLDSMYESDAKYSRERFVILAMLNMYLRVSDLARHQGKTPLMIDFYHKRSGWWFTAFGKRAKEADIAANSRVISALKDYRHYLGLSSYPTANEDTTLINNVNGTKVVTSGEQIRVMIRTGIKKAIISAEKKNWPEEDLTRLRSITAHWLRHTGISEGVKHRPISHVQKDARHNNVGTTSLYIDTDDAERNSTA